MRAIAILPLLAASAVAIFSDPTNNNNNNNNLRRPGSSRQTLGGSGKDPLGKSLKIYIIGLALCRSVRGAVTHASGDVRSGRRIVGGIRDRPVILIG